MDLKNYFIHEWTTQAIRIFFLGQNYHEIQTPTLLPQIPVEPNLYPLKTIWNQKNFTFYLPTSPENSLKKLISQGIGNCFAIAKVFRDLEDIGPTHNLEFSMVEWYEMGKNYKDIAVTTKNLVLSVLHQVQKKLNQPQSNIITYQNKQINLGGDWYQSTLSDLFQKYANMDLSKNLTTQEIITTAASKGYNVDGVTTWEPLYTQIFINEIELKLPQDKPFLIFDYPAQTSSFCQKCPNSPGFNQRFEFYIGGMEIGNAYTESTDQKVLQKNFECEYLPSCAGIGLGIDRLAMLIADTNNIENVLYFPTAKLVLK